MPLFPSAPGPRGGRALLIFLPSGVSIPHYSEAGRSPTACKWLILRPGLEPDATEWPICGMSAHLPKYLTEQELRSLLGVVRDPRDRAIFTVAFWRGLRASEVGLLRLSDLRLKEGRLYVRRLKGSRSGEYLLSDEELKTLRAWLKVRGREPGPLFPSRRSRPISRYQLDRLMKQYGAAAGLPPEKRHFHVLKHTIATWLMGQPGADIRRVQDWLGHANIQNTTIYAQITSAERDDFARRIYGRSRCE